MARKGEVMKNTTIEISVIENKIKRLDNEREYYINREHFDYDDGEFDYDVADIYGYKISVLKELLEEVTNE